MATIPPGPEALLNAIASALSFSGPIDLLPGFVVERVQRLQQGAEAARAALRELDAQLPPLREALTATNERNAALEAEGNALRTEVAALEKQLAAVRDEVATSRLRNPEKS